MIIVDAHLDLAYNALSYGRDLRQPLAEVRAMEPRLGRPEQGVATVTLPEAREGGVGLVFGTLFTLPATSIVSGISRLHAYRTPAQAHRLAQAQFDYYHRLVDEDATIRLVGDRASLTAVLESHADSEKEPLLGIVPLMEGAAPIREPAELEMWVERGLRLVGPAWEDTPYAPGTKGAGGRFTRKGRRLLEVMADLGVILDITHLAEEAVAEALDDFPGVIVATHANARSLVPGPRQLSDTTIRRLAERDGVIGVVLFNVFLRADHRKGERRERVTIDHIVAHIDHMCQLLGDARHVGIGSDLDGGFGRADTPDGIDSVADLTAVGTALRARGYDADDVAAIMGGNWVSLLQRAWEKG